MYNNVIYDFQGYSYTAGNTGGLFTHDLVNNYFITGPATTSASDTIYQVNNQKFYFTGNLLDSNKDGTLNGSSMGAPGETTSSGGSLVGDDLDDPRADRGGRLRQRGGRRGRIAASRSGRCAGDRRRHVAG